MSTEKRGKSMFTNERDASITTCGLLKSIIESGQPPKAWPKLIVHALRVQQYGTRKSLGIPTKWESDSDGSKNSKS